MGYHHHPHSDFKVMFQTQLGLPSSILWLSTWKLHRGGVYFKLGKIVATVLILWCESSHGRVTVFDDSVNGV